MRYVLIPFVLQTLVHITYSQQPDLSSMDDDHKCEDIRTDICKGIPYNQTIFPNNLKHRSQYEAISQLEQFKPLVDFQCAPNIRLFLCSVYIPMCSDYKKAFPPCRNLCEESRRGCEPKMIRLVNIKWPENLDCDKFPVKSEPGQICFGRPDTPGTNQLSCVGEDRLTCPGKMAVPEMNQFSYEFMDMENCGAPCEENNMLFWDKEQRRFAAMWVGVWSFLCAVSTLFTVFTYCIDVKRFLYPERPIVFLSGCYLGVSIAYIAGFFLGNDIACRQFHSESCPIGEPISSCPMVVTQGAREAGCTVLFMMVYFFSMASSVWWIILTVTWFLAAGLKWGNEAIEAKSPYFHGAAWTLPALQTIVVLITSKIEGDVLSGVCFVGIYNTDYLLWFLIVPLTVYLLVGTAFLIAGFISMFNIRNIMKHDVGTKVEKLEKLMVKIGVFSVLYTVPATVMIACHFYEYFNRESWIRGWMASKCRSMSVPCICNYEDDKDSGPDFIVFAIKYFMMLIVGLTSGFWIWSSKTVESWTNFKEQYICCCRSNIPRSGAVYHRGTNGTGSLHQTPQDHHQLYNPQQPRYINDYT